MNKYKVLYSKHVVRDLKKLDKHTSSLIYAWIDKNLVDCESPRQHGKALVGNLSGLWRYRLGDYRLIAEIQDDAIVIHLITVQHRSEVYR